MGRGLSELQKTILRAALENRKKPFFLANKTRDVDLLYAEILATYYGFEPSPSCGSVRDRGQVFDRQAIGVAHYNCAESAVSRAVGRLEQRGLVTVMVGAYSRWAGVNLTENGAAAAERLKG